MAPSAADHQRQRQMLLFQKLLNQRDSASPLTLVVDSLEQPAGPLVTEFALRSKKAAKAKIIYLSFSTLKKPAHADVHLSGRGKSLAAVRTELMKHFPAVDPKTPKQAQRALVILDSLNPLVASNPDNLIAFLSNAITPAVSLVAIYHSDVPVVLPRNYNDLAHEIERQKARNRSVPEPEFGLREGREGVLIGLQERKPGGQGNGFVVQMELRRRSGRPVTGTFENYPGFKPPEDEGAAASQANEGEEQPQSTFNLGLTDKQRSDREGIVLPYFDAQTDIGGGEGGRILYEMGREDDFDDEEDEI
ncbi:unnamed protein product [Parascedosporium putredinis]|uniref:Elongator complex protein 5 n=1 Tax=Parascedosporium putredinis TaxID=1442378 RepID=A0A9P1GTV9_9PEZI|nr:unnamed protein product [Parascedosporium putredinis]CAI7987544.1 unnamed protein product [Parascedosporium putredinis]